MGFSEAIKSVFSQYATFSGRARRSEYWYFYLFLVLVQVGGTILSAIDFFVGFPFISISLSLVSLALIIPTLAVTVRRLHDTGKTGWYFLLLVVIPSILAFAAVLWAILLAMFQPLGTNPDLMSLLGFPLIAIGLSLVGQLILFIFLVQDSDKGENKYGPSPKY